MMRILFSKNGHADDATPSGAIAALAVPKRVFDIPADVESSQRAGAKTGNLCCDFSFVDATQAVVTGITCTAQLVTLDDAAPGSERWLTEGAAVAGIAEGAAAYFPFPAIAESKRAFLKITTVAGANVANVAAIIVRGEPRGVKG